MSPALPMSPQVFAILSDLIESHSGLHYGPENQELLADKVTGPALDAGFDSLLDYYYYLRYDPAGPKALEKLVEALLVHETYFFREETALRALVDQVLVPLVQQGVRPRVWCAACATGEEAITVAILLAEKGILSKVELLATDLSQPALDRARRGEFGRRALRALPPDIEGRYLEVRQERAVVRPDLREAIGWGRVNLTDDAAVAKLGLFNAILCRNVLIYFSDDTASRVVRRLSSSLLPGGHLLVGTSESLLRFGSGLDCEEKSGAYFYTKVAA